YRDHRHEPCHGRTACHYGEVAMRHHVTEATDHLAVLLQPVRGHGHGGAEPAARPAQAGDDSFVVTRVQPGLVRCRDETERGRVARTTRVTMVCAEQRSVMFCLVAGVVTFMSDVLRLVGVCST